MSRYGRTLVVLSVALLAVSSVSAPAETDVYASGVIRGKYLYNTDDDIESSAADTRVELDLYVGSFTLGAVYRGYQLTDSSYNPAGIDVPEAYLKHRYAAWQEDDLSARAGHFAATFGHGLTLRSYEEVDLEHDTLLDGFYAEYSSGLIDITALAGVAEEYDSATRFYSHVVRGARASMPVGEFLEIAGSVVERARTWEEEAGQVESEFARFEDGVVGGEASAWIGPLTLAAEYVDRGGEYPDVEGDALNGHATYGAATVDLGWATLFGEVKDYDDFAHYVVSPPTCVRDHLFTLMNRATYQPDLNDERGFLVEGSAPIGEDLYVTGGASEARNHDSDLRHWEMFGHATYSLGDATVGLAGSMSREYLFGAGGATGKFTEHMIGAAETEFAVSDEHVVELTVEAQAVEEPSGLSYEDYIVAAAWYAGVDLTFTLAVEGTSSDTEDRTRWTMLSAKKMLPGELEVELGAGTERGGKKCTGGTCYFEPEFEGVRLRLTKFF